MNGSALPPLVLSPIDVQFPPLSDDPSAPIGFFDSGVGGLTVVAALLRRHPAERVMYLGDQGHVPYGGRPLEQIRGFARGITRMLATAQVKAIVMACNISSATTWAEMAQLYGPGRMFGMIEPGAAAARATSKTGCIGVLATAGTVASKAYTRALQGLDPDLRVIEVPCPRFVPLVEAGETETNTAVEAARTYLHPLAACDTAILGCTHYPYLLPALERARSHALTFVDPAEAVADAISRELGARTLLAPARISRPTAAAPSALAEHHLITTGDAAKFAAQVPRFLPGVAARVHALAWTTSSAA